MKIVIPRERAPGERRVAATPETVGKLRGLGAEVAVERDAGAGAAFPDAAYTEAGAEIAADPAALYAGAHVVLRAAPPSPDELKGLARGTLLVGMLGPRGDAERVQSYADAGVTALAMELLPRITRAQPMDVLSSQSNIAGYGAVLLAATHYPSLFPMMMTAAGTIAAARVLVLGAGVAGLQAIATARRLGAVVMAYDVRPAVREQVESLGAKFVAVESEETAEAETSGGYAKEMSEAHKEKEREALAKEVAKASVVVTTAQIPGRPAPVLITEEMARQMKPGSVIVDLAAETGGNCALTKAGETIEEGGVTIIGAVNLPAHWPTDSSRLLARNLLAFLQPLFDKESGTLKLDTSDEVVAGCLLTRDGEVVHPDFAPAAA
jgi:NAD(P) transhydrogenase subunit alpha